MAARDFSGSDPVRSGGRLSPDLSLYLDLLRLGAAFAVFLGHAHGLLFPEIGPDLLFGHSREAVAIFFVLSGFVICHVATAKEGDWRSYVTARAARIYSVALPALAVTLLCDTIGRSFGAAAYARYDFFVPESVEAVLSQLTFTSQLWFRHDVFGSDEPYWSLGFEVWYYVLFGCLAFVPGRAKWGAAVAWGLVCGPRIVAYLPLWWLGVLLHRHAPEGVAQGARRRRDAAMFAVTFVLYLAVWAGLGDGARAMFKSYSPVEDAVTWVYFTGIGGLVFLNMLLFDRLGPVTSRLGARVERAIRWAAGGSFTLYLVHQPILAMIAALFPTVTTSPVLGVVAALATLAAVFGLAELGERRKKAFARPVRRLIEAVFGRAEPAPRA